MTCFLFRYIFPIASAAGGAHSDTPELNLIHQLGYHWQGSCRSTKGSAGLSILSRVCPDVNRIFMVASLSYLDLPTVGQMHTRSEVQSDKGKCMHSRHLWREQIKPSGSVAGVETGFLIL